MNTLIAAVAQYLPLLVPVVAAGVWLTLGRRGRVDLAGRAVITLVILTVLIQVAGAIHQDPRPFVVDPRQPALFPHPADNGFPSDHTALAAAVAMLVINVRRRTGLMLLAAAVLAGLARVAAHVHHVQDIVGGLALAAVAVAAATLLWRLARERVPVIGGGQGGRRSERLGSAARRS